ncbi:uncharacterized protein LAJ45_05176 [Morchella importuna]|uniref:uncharacterized protein n=1 Tax=Morchella importuna TaxID=1174673 RepID=UPI001E8E49F2|nr:uncharacterized protein LAJ45_05176 [Morchella importuna]KAH8150993.1 hypothetical protein LAJ45_05176 [Morchella importuna]
MSDAESTWEASSATSIATPDVVVPPHFRAELESLSAQETLMLKLQSDKTDSLRALHNETDTLLTNTNVNRSSAVDILRWEVLREREFDYATRLMEESVLLGKMTEVVRESRQMRVVMLRREMDLLTEQTLNERNQLRVDVRKEKALHKVTMAKVEALQRQLDEEKNLHEETRLMRDQQISERNDKEKELTLEVVHLRAQLSEEKRLHVEAGLVRKQQISEQNDKAIREVTLEVVSLRAQLSEEKKLREEARLARDQFSQQNNVLGGLTGESHSENNELLEKISREREIREEMKSEIREEMKSEIREGMKSEIEKLHAELLKTREHLREEIKGEIKLEQAEQEKSRRVLLEQRAREMRDLQQTTARD